MNKLVTPSRRSGRSPFHLASASGVSPPRSLMMKTMAITISIAALEEESSRSVFSTVHVIFGTRIKNAPLRKGSHRSHALWDSGHCFTYQTDPEEKMISCVN